MSVEYLPVGVACNIKCDYCYEEPMRVAGNINTPRNWERVKSQLVAHNQDFTLFGGEPLLAPIEHIREVWQFGMEQYGKNGIQTNGSLITDEHIQMIIDYNVSVGISIDGPAQFNLARCAPEITEQSMTAIRKLCERNHPPSLIVTIHKGNNDLIRMVHWLDDLVIRGVKYFNFHEMELECGQESYALEQAANIRMFLGLYEWSKRVDVHINPFIDIKNLLTTRNANALCVWNHCDPQTTAAVQGVNSDGSKSNCGRTNKDGVNWVKADKPGFERQFALYHTPQAYGGCKDCKYFLFCKGQCPGTGIDEDWRNRSSYCKTWYALFEAIAEDNKENLIPEDTVKQLERALLRNLGGKPSGHVNIPHVNEHEDHWDGPGIPAIILDRSPLDESVTT